jgi:acetyl-CoA acetyltransferase
LELTVVQIVSSCGTPNSPHPSVVITFAKRTALGKARKGAFKDMSVQELLIAYFKAALPELKVDPALIGDITVGKSKEQIGHGHFSNAAQDCCALVHWRLCCP